MPRGTKTTFTSSQRKLLVKLRQNRLSIDSIAEIMGVASSTLQRYLANDPTFAAEARARPSRVPMRLVKKKNEPFNLAVALKTALPEVYEGLMDEARTGKGTARVAALNVLKTWAAELETDAEPLELEDQHPERLSKVIPIGGA